MTNRALIIVDVQNDFAAKNGALAVSSAEDIYAPLERLLKRAKQEDWTIILTKDNHPANHSSFKSNGGVWPDHCVQNTWGNEISSELQAILLNLSINADIITKGENSDVEEYSGVNARMKKILDDNNILEVYVCGLATDYCVISTAEDLANENFFTYIVIDGCRHVFDSNFYDVIYRAAERGIEFITLKNV